MGGGDFFEWKKTRNRASEEEKEKASKKKISHGGMLGDKH